MLKTFNLTQIGRESNPNNPVSGLELSQLMTSPSPQQSESQSPPHKRAESTFLKKIKLQTLEDSHIHKIEKRDSKPNLKNTEEELKKKRMWKNLMQQVGFSFDDEHYSKYPILPGVNFFISLSKLNNLDTLQVNIPEMIAYQNNNNCILYTDPVSGSVQKRIDAGTIQMEQIVLDYQSSVITHFKNLQEKIGANRRFNQHFTFEELILKLDHQVNSELPYSVLKSQGNTLDSTHQYVYTFKENKQRKPANDNNQIQQQFLYSKGLHGSMIRFVYFTKNHRGQSANYAFRFQNNFDIFNIYSKKSVTTKACINSDIVNSFQVQTIRGTLQDYQKQAENLVKFIEKIYRVRLMMIVLDFVQDLNSQIWLINVKHFELEHAIPISEIQGSGDNQKTLDQLSCSVYCQLCTQSFKQDDANQTLTYKLLWEFIEHLQSRNVFLKGIGISHSSTRPCRVCNTCYMVVVGENELIALERKKAILENIAVQGEDQKRIQNTGEIAQQRPALLANQLFQWRLFIYFENMNRIKLPQNVEKKDLFFQFKLNNGNKTVIELFPNQIKKNYTEMFTFNNQRTKLMERFENELDNEKFTFDSAGNVSSRQDTNGAQTTRPFSTLSTSRITNSQMGGGGATMDIFQNDFDDGDFIEYQVFEKLKENFLQNNITDFKNSTVQLNNNTINQQNTTLNPKNFQITTLNSDSKASRIRAMSANPSKQAQQTDRSSINLPSQYIDSATKQTKETNEVEKFDDLRLNIKKVFYFFSETEDIGDFLKDSFVTCRLTDGGDWNKIVAEGSSKNFGQFKNKSKQGQRISSQLLMFNDVSQYFPMNCLFGVVCDDTYNTGHLNLTPNNGVYFPDQDYFNCNPFPDIWMEYFDQNYIERRNEFQSQRKPEHYQPKCEYKQLSKMIDINRNPWHSYYYNKVESIVAKAIHTTTLSNNEDYESTMIGGASSSHLRNQRSVTQQNHPNYQTINNASEEDEDEDYIERILQDQALKQGKQNLQNQELLSQIEKKKYTSEKQFKVQDQLININMGGQTQSVVKLENQYNQDMLHDKLGPSGPYAEIKTIRNQRIISQNQARSKSNLSSFNKDKEANDLYKNSSKNVLFGGQNSFRQGAGGERGVKQISNKELKFFDQYLNKNSNKESMNIINHEEDSDIF